MVAAAAPGVVGALCVIGSTDAAYPCEIVGGVLGVYGWFIG
jgi:hypothetical protein